MAKSYTVEDDKGRQVTFEWDGDGDPTEADLEEVFAATPQYQGPQFLQKLGSELDQGPEPTAHILGRFDTGVPLSEYRAAYDAATNDYVRPIVKGIAGGATAVAAAPLGLPAAAAAGGAAMTGADKLVDLATGENKGATENAVQFAENAVYALGVPGTASIPKAVLEAGLSNAMGGDASRALRGQSGDLATEVGRNVEDFASGAAAGAAMTVAPHVAEKIPGAARATVKAVKSPKQTAAKIGQRIKATQQKAGAKVITESMTKTGEIADKAQKNLAEAIQVADEIGGGWNVGLGEATGDPKTLGLQRKLQMQDANAQAERAELELNNLKQEETYLQKRIADGEGGLEDALAKLKANREALSKQAADAADALEARASQLSAVGKEKAGATLRERAQEIRAGLKKQASELYGAVNRDLELDDATVQTWDEGLQAEREAVNEAFNDPAKNPIGLIERARAGLAEDQATQFAIGDNVRAMVNGQEMRGPVTKVEMRGDGGNKVPFYTIKTDKGEFTVRWDKAHDIPKVRAETPVPVSLKRTELKDGMRVVDPEMGPGTISVNPTTLYRTFKADAGGQYSFPLGSGASSNGTSLYAEGAPAPKPSSIHPNTAKVGARIVHPENGPGTIEVVHPESGSVQVRYDSDGELVNLTRNDQERTKYEQAPKAAEPEAEAAPEKPKRSKPITFGYLMDFRKQVVGKMLDAKGKNPELAEKLGRVLKTVEAAMVKAGENPAGGEAVAALRKANDFYRDVYVPRVRQGATGKVLRPNRSGTGGMSVSDIGVGHQYFRPGDEGLTAAQDFKRTFGDDADAKQAVEAYAARDLYEKATGDGTTAVNPVAVANWLRNHAKAIKELGLEGKLGGIKQAIKTLEGARGMKAEFEKSQFSKAIDGDPEQAVKTIFAGGNAKATQDAMRRLVAAVKDSPAALNGLKRAFADHMRAETRLSAENPLVADNDTASAMDRLKKRAASLAKTQAFFQKYEGAMRELYSEAEMKAMETIRKAISIKARINQPTSQVAGSQTADLLQNITRKAITDSLPSLLRPIVGHFDKVWQDAVREYAVRAMYDPRMARKLVDLDLLAKKDPKTATAELKAEVAQTVSDTGPTALNNRKFEELRQRLNSITDDTQRNDIIREIRNATNAELSPEQQAKLWEKIANTDPLTQLGSLLKFSADIDGQHPLTWSADMSGLGFTNDTFGHPAGNKVLRQVGKALEHAGIANISARIGGDEFGGGAQNQAQLDKAAEFLQKSVFYFPGKDGKMYRVHGFDITFGSGSNYKEADAAQKIAHDAKREQRGGKGAKPTTLTVEEVNGEGQ